MFIGLAPFLCSFLGDGIFGLTHIVLQSQEKLGRMKAGFLCLMFHNLWQCVSFCIFPEILFHEKGIGQKSQRGTVRQPEETAMRDTMPEWDVQVALICWVNVQFSDFEREAKVLCKHIQKESANPLAVSDKDPDTKQGPNTKCPHTKDDAETA